MEELNGISEVKERWVITGDITLGSPVMTPERSWVLNYHKKKSRHSCKNHREQKISLQQSTSDMNSKYNSQHAYG